MPRRSPLPFAIAAVLLAFVAAGVGCSRSRTVTIEAHPRDAVIRVGDRVRGPGPVTETFAFSGGVDRYRISVEREGYKTYLDAVSRDDPRERIIATLKPVPRPITFSISPLPAVVSINGKRVNEVPARQVDTQLLFEVDGRGQWNSATVKVEREEFAPYVREIKYEDRQNPYPIDLQAKRKNVVIATSPEKAEVYVNGQSRGTSPVTMDNYEFPVDTRTGDYVPHQVRVEKKGYQTLTKEIRWDDGQESYAWTLEPLKKRVRITTEPKGATVTIGENAVPVQPDAGGAYVQELTFGPPNEKGELKEYKCRVVAANTADQMWEEHNFEIRWDAGQTDYPVRLKEILVRTVPVVRPVMSLGADGSWSVTAQAADTVGVKDTGEASEGDRPAQVTKLARDQVLDTLAVSPDGSQLVYTLLSDTAGGPLTARVVAQKTDGSAEPRDLTDGTSLDITPSFTPDGSRIVFASNRGGRKLSIWSMSTSGDGPAPERLTVPVENHDLSPAIDSNPKPRLFYETYIETRPGPRVYSTPSGAMLPRDLAPAGGTQPRVAPTADAVLFAVRDAKTNKRDVFRMSVDGRDVTNLTNTPDVDEYDACWSPDGLRVAYVSDQGRTKEAPDNTDVWLLDPAGGSEPVRVTTNPSLDDCPAWGEDGRSIYFRSNRGGQWNVWRMDLK